MVGPLYNHLAGFICVQSKMEQDARKYNQELETNDDETAAQFQGVLGSILWFDFVSHDGEKLYPYPPGLLVLLSPAY